MPEALEVIAKGSATDSHPIPLLFVHGAWHAAWCWDDHFLDFFADRGYHAVALSLRGHGTSTTAKPLRRCSFADYLADIAAVADTLPTAPVLVGHSMGGYLVQKYLQTRAAPAAVLMASMPPSGYIASGLRWLRRHPWHFARMSATGRSLPYVGTLALARERFFSPSTPDDVVANCVARLQEESARSGLDGLYDRPRPERVETPVLVLGARRDGAVTELEVHETARAYRTTAELFPDMGHNMMLEPGWAAVGNRIDEWLGARGL
ncbi:alpha/beta hydrolase [Mycolicibacterium duvalii]|uniref:Alpha/beta hydrolase n=1 Tax=Mycolicibacterium duvalii TaxID=39688 RepID=A0A7I7JYP1_9MYCO|nr:alpha/beta fold hydrolase [Mycolicibacterium duvalii]MCV7369707.1 alpha/beta fold hydrolase [Mycolicibacterium duvalii]PEG38007.1 alpha/beta hydrolase [Mycolicibacterium duvalii]BBX16434.1 alpha/beta hydrolase [Mycolicibacterium duvalii]